MVALAAIIRALAVALWVGGMAALDFIDAPLRFTTPALTRNQAVALGQAVFVRFNRVEVVLGMVAVRAAAAGRSARWTLAVAALMLVLALVQKYREEGAAFVPKYLDMLAAGGSLAPDELVGRLGVDVKDPAFWELGLRLLDGMVTEAEQLAAQV